MSLQHWQNKWDDKASVQEIETRETKVDNTKNHWKEAARALRYGNCCTALCQKWSLDRFILKAKPEHFAEKIVYRTFKYHEA